MLSGSDRPVLIHPQAVVSPLSEIRGWAAIGPEAVVEDDVVIENSVLWPGSRVTAGARVRDSVLADRAVAAGGIDGAAVVPGS